MSEIATRLIGLLDYIEQVEKMKRKPVYVVPSDVFAAYQTEMKGLPGIEFNIQSGDDDIWVRVPRLNEIPPPDLDEKLKQWVSLSRSPDKTPELKKEIPILSGREEIGRAKVEDHPEIGRSFDWYVSELWRPWSAIEKPRRRTINFYNKLFSVHQAIATNAAEAPIELVWGLGYACWRKEGRPIAVQHPLITQPCEILLDERTFDIDIRPRDTDANLELDCYADLELPGVRYLEDYWKSAAASAENRVNPFEASTFEGTLKAAVTHLDSNGSYLANQLEPTIPAPSENLCITDTWVIFARKRTDHIFLQDIERLKKKLSVATEIPSVVASFVEPGDSTINAHQPVPFRGLSSSAGGRGVRELYFPMPYNEEQVSIVEKLESNDGVVVQGPPGTGKTHTIANVICHFLAQGKRVLVTAKGESALTVLQEKLPEQIRPLSVSLLTDERDGKRQFEHSIQTIASRVSALNPIQSAKLIVALDERLNALHSKIARIDLEMTSYAEKHMQHYPFRGRELSPEELAKFVLENVARFEWMDDELEFKTSSNLTFGDEDIVSLRKSRLQVGVDITYLGYSLPVSDNFPRWQDVLAAHKDLVRAKEIEHEVSRGLVLGLADSTSETFDRAKILAVCLADRQTLKQAIESAGFGWSATLEAHFEKTLPGDSTALALQTLAREIEVLEAKRKKLLARAIDIPPDAETHEDFQSALLRLMAAKSPFALPFGKQEARQLVAAIKVAGLPPTSVEDWKLVEAQLQYRLEARRLIARWNALATDLGTPIAQDTIENSFRLLVQWQSHSRDIYRLVVEFNKQLPTNIEAVFGAGAVNDLTKGEKFLFTLSASLSQHIDKHRLAQATQQISALLSKLNGKSGVVVDKLRDFITSQLGSTSIEESDLLEEWHGLMQELGRLASIQGALATIGRVSSLVEASGAKKWAHRICSQAAGPDNDPQTPSDWLEAWNWRIALTFLEKIDGRGRLKALFEERRTLESDLAKTYQELVAEKTWLGVYNNSPVSIRQALAAYLSAIQAMGTGNGIRAIRHRQNARTAMERAYRAVPCWVLPQWRVSETIPSEIGLFDLVVIDEASQSDIWALPALLRGKKILVVGDHKQVSPSAVGTAEVKILELVERFLCDQPHGAQMTPDKSIYDLASVVFAGNSVMLREHFRCVPAIIEFSNREFYKGDIKPLRIPKAHERLDPPLIDVFVRGGHRKGDVNASEARAIVNEIKDILVDKSLEGRSIGIVTLLGIEQASYIAKLLNAEVSPSHVVERQIAVGPPPVFQGRERDIMLVSMVLAPGDRATATKQEMEQRFNVALSRARDRTYLFRSVQEDAFGVDTLTAKVIRHFRHPFNMDAGRVSTLRELCESDFEREMFDALTNREYRVKPQVRCAGYRIDFVVEGAEGRRLAIECDGDRFHGPGQWSDDMIRQRVLERAGWTFWRCFASSFVLRREQVLSDLFATLERMGIQALGSESVDNTIWTLSKEVDPYAVNAPEETDEQLTD